MKMEIKQKIEDNGRIQNDSKDKFKHWSRRHEELELVYVECIISSTSYVRLIRYSEEEEEEEETIEGEPSTSPPEPAGTAEGVATEDQPGKKSKNEPLELVEYSRDELRSVDKEMLNAEITQLEGQSAGSIVSLAD